MRVIAHNPFDLTNFAGIKGSSIRRVPCQPGTYELVEGIHPEDHPALRRPDNPILFLEGHPGIGASKGWWLNEIEHRRMEDITPTVSNPCVIARKEDFFGS